MQSQLNPWLVTYLPLASTLVVAIATVVLVFLNSRYVRLTARIVEETQKSREPSVTADFEMPDHSLRLVVENHGLSPAKNVRFFIIKDVEWIKFPRTEGGLKNLGPIQNGISYLTPSRKLKYYIGYPRWNDTPDDKMSATFRISYESEFGKRFESTIEFDFSQMRDVLFESYKDSNLAVAEAIKESERSRQSNQNMQDRFKQFSRPQLKKCKMCAEMIPKEAKKCSRCLELQDNDESQVLTKIDKPNINLNQ